MLHKVQDARRVTYPAAKTRFVPMAFQKFNSEQKHRDVVGIQRHHPFRVIGGTNIVLQLKTRFDKSAVDSRAVRIIRIFLQEAFEVADESGAIASRIIERALQFLLRQRLLAGSFVFGAAVVRRSGSSPLAFLCRRGDSCGHRQSQRAEAECPQSVWGEGAELHAGILNAMKGIVAMLRFSEQ